LFWKWEYEKFKLCERNVVDILIQSNKGFSRYGNWKLSCQKILSHSSSTKQAWILKITPNLQNKKVSWKALFSYLIFGGNFHKQILAEYVPGYPAHFQNYPYYCQLSCRVTLWTDNGYKVFSAFQLEEYPK
jgi:hypothetical protein